jgi:hypothetical protein
LLFRAKCRPAGNMAQKVALNNGVCGQDGSYLAELLLEKS